MATLCARAFFMQKPIGVSELMCVRKRLATPALWHTASLTWLSLLPDHLRRPALAVRHAEQTLCTEHQPLVVVRARQLSLHASPLRLPRVARSEQLAA